ncbi:glycoside hydrolase [Collybia nuda]|uniref:Alpha-galactosidase n=1 Tax=Collybia nuda TaxID=64659 RepID=A0A9P5YA38_9AGAR|nr:glycoside hydrolase [Collybia nuda]
MFTQALLTLSLASVVFSQSGPYGQCGGQAWTGPTICQPGWLCTPFNARYSQCLPASSTVLMSPTGTDSIKAAAPTDPPSTKVGRLPALGWNSWNAYRCDINEAKVIAAANQFVSLGLQAAGYQYINIDDCWSNKARDATTKRIVPDPTKFPNGISGLAAEVHALGLKIGIYSDAGTATCAGYPGSLGFESVDAMTWNEWGIDYLKYDNCNVPGNWSDSSTPPGGDWYNSNSAIRYRQMTAALVAQPQPIQYSICIWGNAHVWDWGGRVGHSWRMSGDSSPTWSYITSIINTNLAHLASIQFGAHNDMDMMEIGNGALTIQEQRTHFAAWVFLKSPILLGTDMSKLTAAQLAIIKNTELLGFHQDIAVGTPAAPFKAYSTAPTTSPPEYYSGTSSKGTHVFIINTSANTTTKHFTLSSVPGLGTSGNFRLHDMWTGTDISGTYEATSSFSVSVAAHDTAAYRITKV